VRLIATISLQCKFAILEQIFTKMRLHVERADALAAFRRWLKPPHADAIFGLCEKLINQ